MKTALIIHGAYGSPQENWFPWLKFQLEGLGYQVEVPQMPTPEHQDIDHWLATIKPYKQKLDETSIIVGHSIGATFALRVLEALDHPTKATILVSGFVADLPDPKFNAINHTFYDHPFDWESIKQNAGQISIFHSDNDPYVPLSRAQEIAQHLEIEVEVIVNAGHFNTASGYTEFPELLKAINSNLIG